MGQCTPATVAAPLFSALVLLLFVVGFGWDAYRVWTSSSTPPDNPALTQVWTGVAALVGGITAVLLGVEHVRLQLATCSPMDKSFFQYAFSLSYCLVGISAVVTWLLRTSQVTALVRNAATTFLGLAIPVVASYMNYASPS